MNGVDMTVLKTSKIQLHISNKVKVMQAYADVGNVTQQNETI